MMMVRHVMAPALALLLCGVTFADGTGRTDADQEHRHRSYREQRLADPVSRIETSHALLVREAGDWTAELTVDDKNAIVTLAVLPGGQGTPGLPKGPQRATLEVTDAGLFGEPIELELLPILPAQEPASDYALFVGRHEALIGADEFALTVTLTDTAATETVRFDVDTGLLAEPLVCPHRCLSGREFAEKGNCPVCGHALVPVESAHGDHSPKHGGVLFMASDGWHHIEGALVDDGEFRLYLYNDFTRPIPSGHLLGDVRGRAFAGAQAGSTSVELSFSAAEDGTFLSAAIPEQVTTPMTVDLELRFPGRDESDRYTFFFE